MDTDKIVRLTELARGVDLQCDARRPLFLQVVRDGRPATAREVTAALILRPELRHLVDNARLLRLLDAGGRPKGRSA